MRNDEIRHVFDQVEGVITACGEHSQTDAVDGAADSQLAWEAYGVRVGSDVVDEFVFRLDVGGLDAGAHRFGRHVGISRRCWLRRGACGIPWRRRRRERIDLRQHAAVGEIPPYAQFRIVELSPIGLLATDDAWGEWGAEDFMSATGLNYVPQYIAHGFRCLLYVSSHQQ